jgi:hypothetical protein
MTLLRKIPTEMPGASSPVDAVDLGGQYRMTAHDPVDLALPGSPFPPLFGIMKQDAVFGSLTLYEEAP